MLHPEEAILGLREAAEQGDTDSELALALSYDTGRGVPKDEKEALLWYRRAAEHGNAIAQYRLGSWFANAHEDYKDDVEAALWFRRAAEQGYVDAQYNLAVSLAHGKGVKRDEAEAFSWYMKAALQGDAPSQYCVAVMFYNGDIVERDDVAAYRWASRAAADGQDRAREILTKTENRMSPEAIEEVKSLLVTLRLPADKISHLALIAANLALDLLWKDDQERFVRESHWPNLRGTFLTRLLRPGRRTLSREQIYFQVYVMQYTLEGAFRGDEFATDAALTFYDQALQELPKSENLDFSYTKWLTRRSEFEAAEEEASERQRKNPDMVQDPFFPLAMFFVMEICGLSPNLELVIPLSTNASALWVAFLRLVREYEKDD